MAGGGLHLPHPLKDGTQLTAKNAYFINKNFRHVELQQILNEHKLSLTGPKPNRTKP